MRKMNCLFNGKWQYNFMIVFVIFCIFGTAGCSTYSDLDGETPSQIGSDIDLNGEDSVIKLYTSESYEGWEKAYENVILNAEDYLSDLELHEIRDLDSNSESLVLYLEIHDFNSDGVPELVLSDKMFIGIYTFEDSYVKRIAHLYVDEYMYGVNGCHYAQNCIYFQSDGSDGSSYLCCTFYDGEYVTGFYDDYQPERYILNKKEVSNESFNHVFNMNEMKDYQHNRLGYFELDKENGMLRVLYDTELLKKDEVINIETILNGDFDIQY